jgi:hypothetical protein
MLDELTDVVQGESRLQMTEIPGVYLEALFLVSWPAAYQLTPQRLVDYVGQGTIGPARFRPELGRHIIIQGERHSHALMLWSGHHLSMWNPTFFKVNLVPISRPREQCFPGKKLAAMVVDTT